MITRGHDTESTILNYLIHRLWVSAEGDEHPDDVHLPRKIHVFLASSLIASTGLGYSVNRKSFYAVWTVDRI